MAASATVTPAIYLRAWWISTLATLPLPLGAYPQVSLIREKLTCGSRRS